MSSQKEKRTMINKKYLIIGIIAFLLALVAFVSFGEKNVDVEIIKESNSADLANTNVKGIQETTPTTNTGEINYQAYNYQFAEGPVTEKLTKMLGSSGTIAFYLPPTKYINIEQGSNYGVAFALNNPNPSGENYFEYEFHADPGTPETCNKITTKEADTWIKSGHKSFGKIPKGWVDHMTVYFEFPEDVTDCNIKYNFEVTKDGVAYGSEVVEFNIG